MNTHIGHHMGYDIYVNRLTGISSHAAYVQIRKNNTKIFEFTLTLEEIYNRSIFDHSRARIAQLDQKIAEFNGEPI